MALPPIVIVTSLAVAAMAQAPAPSWLKPSGRVAAQVALEPATKGAAPGSVVLAVDVTPAPGIHVYAPGNSSYIPVEITIDASSSVKPGTAVFPPSEPFVFGELRETVQVYQKPFRVRQPVMVQHVQGRTVTVTGRLRYQACTDKVCFPPESIPLEISVPPRRR